MTLLYLLILLIVSSINTRLSEFSLFTFFVAWLFQFIGHRIEGKKPSFFKDLQFLLIGPIWCLVPGLFIKMAKAELLMTKAARLSLPDSYFQLIRCRHQAGMNQRVDGFKYQQPALLYQH